MPDEPGVTPGSPLAPPPPGTPQKGARPPPGSDSEPDSGFSDSGSEHLGRCEGTDKEEPPGLGHAHLGPQAPSSAHPLLLVLPASPVTVTVPVPIPACPQAVPPVPPELSRCPQAVPRVSPELSRCPQAVPPVSPALSRCPQAVPAVSPALSRCPQAVPAVSPALSRCPQAVPAVSPALSRCPQAVPPVSPALSRCPRGSLGGSLLAALALRTGALLRHSRRTRGHIATLRRHTRLLSRASRDPRLWPRLWHLLGPSPGGFGEGAAGK